MGMVPNYTKFDRNMPWFDQKMPWFDQKMPWFDWKMPCEWNFAVLFVGTHPTNYWHLLITDN